MIYIYGGLAPRYTLQVSQTDKEVEKRGKPTKHADDVPILFLIYQMECFFAMIPTI